MKRSEMEVYLQEKVFLSNEDIRKIFACGKSKAAAIIRAIKSISDRLPFSGRVTVADFYFWLDYVDGKESERMAAAR